jgi:hypothetical protein
MTAKNPRNGMAKHKLPQLAKQKHAFPVIAHAHNQSPITAPHLSSGAAASD